MMSRTYVTAFPFLSPPGARIAEALEALYGEEAEARATELVHHLAQP